jgi:translocation and assembly module TamB
LSLTQSDSLQSRLKLDVHVSTTPELQMQTAVARLSGNADLRCEAPPTVPQFWEGWKFWKATSLSTETSTSLERGDVTFANPARTQPIIDLQATTRVRDYDITVQFRGDASVTNGMKVTWQSEPQLPEADVIALLALGRTQEESAAATTGGGFGFGGEASNLLINQALNSTVNSRCKAPIRSQPRQNRPPRPGQRHRRGARAAGHRRTAGGEQSHPDLQHQRLKFRTSKSSRPNTTSPATSRS